MTIALIQQNAGTVW